MSGILPKRNLGVGEVDGQAGGNQDGYRLVTVEPLKLGSKYMQVHYTSFVNKKALK